MPFRINAKNIFLTYSRCESIGGDTLLSLLESREPTAYFIRTAEESHADGTPHLHALLRYDTKRDIRNERHFDFFEQHPKIEPCRNAGKTLNYLTKEGSYFDFCEEGREIEEEGVPDPEDFENKAQYLRSCLTENIPYGYADQFWKLSERVDKHVYDSGAGTIQNDRLQFARPADDGATLVLGPSGIGKTTWALQHAHKPALLVSHIEDLKSITPKTASIIFDDMDFCHWPRTSQIHLVDKDLPRSINVRYGVVHIAAGVQKIFTANLRPFSMDAAIDRRLTVIDLN